MYSEIILHKAETAADLREAAVLLREYADWLDYDICFRNVEQELAELPGEYGPPHGELLLACVDGEVAGCVALRRWDDVGACEMKRLYVRPAFRGLGLGKLLGEAIIDSARRIGYRRMLLDTLPQRMQPAIALYESLGFHRIEKYRDSPTGDAICMELEL